MDLQSLQHSTGNEVMRDIFPVHDTVLAVPGRKNDSANYDIYFKAEDLPPMGYKTYLLEQIQNQMDTRVQGKAG